MNEKQYIEEAAVKQKELTFDDLGSYQPIQIAKDAKLRKLTSAEVCSGEKTRV